MNLWGYATMFRAFVSAYQAYAGAWVSVAASQKKQCSDADIGILRFDSADPHTWTMVELQHGMPVQFAGVQMSSGATEIMFEHGVRV